MTNNTSKLKAVAKVASNAVANVLTGRNPKRSRSGNSNLTNNDASSSRSASIAQTSVNSRKSRKANHDPRRDSRYESEAEAAGKAPFNTSQMAARCSAYSLDDPDKTWNPVTEPEKSPEARKSGRETPQQTVGSSKSEVDSAKRRAVHADPNKGYCLLTNASTDLDAAHMLPRALSKHLELIVALEEVWYRKKHRLQLDSRWNLFRLTPTFHRKFDLRKFMLIPSLAMLEAMVDFYEDPQNDTTTILEAYDQPAFNVAKEGDVHLFDFYLVPHKKMNDTSIPRRQVRPEIKGQALDRDQETLIYHPYKELGILRSHVYAHFAVYNAGMKLTHKDGDGYDFSSLVGQGLNTEQALKCLDLIVTLFNHWQTAAPAGAKEALADPAVFNNGVDEADAQD